MVTIHRNTQPDGSISVRFCAELSFSKNTPMLEQENSIQLKLNEMGLELTRHLLYSLECDGQPLPLGPNQTPCTAKSERVVKLIETPYGALPMPRHVYQSSAGGACHVPLDKAACLIGNATPKFAQMISHKHTEANARSVCLDMLDNHQRPVSLEQVQHIAQRVGELAARHPSQLDEAELPAVAAVATLSIGVDGACVNMTQSAPNARDKRKGRTAQWRVGMVGTIAMYDKAGTRLATIYQAQSPPENAEDGKRDFWAKMEAEVARFKQRYPAARYVGISDGAPDLCLWLEQHTSVQVLDFYHAAGYLNEAGAAYYTHKAKAAVWSQTAREQLRDEPQAAKLILEDMRDQSQGAVKMSAAARQGLDKAIGYFEPRIERMDYARYKAEGLPIGSGVTEAGCKLIIKQRLCGAGMKWSHASCQHLLTLRSTLHSDGRWHSLWDKISNAVLI